MSTPHADPEPHPDDVVDDRVDLHGDEQRRRADEEPKHEGAPDRSVGTESSAGPDRTPPDVETP